MECDPMGNPSEYVTLYNKGSKRYWQTTIEFLQDADIELVLASMLNQE